MKFFNSVVVLDTNKKEQNPVHPAVARMWLRDRKAAVFRKKPFTIILKPVEPDLLFTNIFDEIRVLS